MRICVHCKNKLPLSSFYKRSDGRIVSRCIECTKRDSNNSYLNNKDTKRDYKRKIKYGITRKEYENLAKKQNYTCAICGEKSIKELRVDHDHKSGKVRSLLCAKCNTRLGFLEKILENELLEKMVDYIAQPR